MGALVGFLWWNAPKAKIFMGDVGSMAIGGVIAAMSILTHTELLGVLVVGTLSLALPDVFQHPTVWSMFGVGYLFIPVALPIVGMWWLLKHRPEGSS